jgi:hypothetical protein
MSILSKFDAYAMVNPKTKQDIIALLDEANAELDNLSQILRQLTAQCEQNKDKK